LENNDNIIAFPPYKDTNIIFCHVHGNITKDITNEIAFYTINLFMNYNSSYTPYQMCEVISAN